MATSSVGQRRVWTRLLAWAVLTYILVAFLVGTGEAVGFVLGLLPRERFVILPPVLTPSWAARQMLSVALGIGLVGYLRGSVLMGRFAGGIAGLIATLQVVSALAEWSKGSIALPISALPYALLAIHLGQVSAQDSPVGPPSRNA